MTNSSWRMLPALFIAGLSALILIDTSALPYWADYSPGPAFGPRWVGAAGLLLAVLSIVQDVRTEGAAVDLPTRRGALRAGMTLLGLFGFVLLAPVIGTLLAAALTTAFIVLVVLRRPLLPGAFTVILTVGLLYGVFVAWLGIPLPKSHFGF